MSVVMSAPRQLRILEVQPEPDRRSPRKAHTPDDIKAASEAEAIRVTRSLRRVYAVGKHWEVISTRGDFRHRIVLMADAEGELVPQCITKECLAPAAHPCWATAKVASSESFRRAYRERVA